MMPDGDQVERTWLMKITEADLIGLGSDGPWGTRERSRGIAR